MKINIIQIKIKSKPKNL